MKYTMHRDLTVVSKFGRAIAFKKGELTHVPDMCAAEVQAQGGVPEHVLDEPEASVLKEPQGTKRAAVLASAIKDMVLGGKREDFTASGAPQVAGLSQRVGFTVDTKERDAAWAAAQNDGT